VDDDNSSKDLQRSIEDIFENNKEKKGSEWFGRFGKLHG